MKIKKVIIVGVALLAAVFTSNAQVFVGGGLGLDLGGGKVKSGGNSSDKPSEFSFEFTPKVGFYLSDDFAIGLQVGIISSSTKYPKGTYGYFGSNTEEVKESMTGWGVGAFARYNVVGGEKLSLLLEGSLGVTGSKSKTKEGSTTTEGDPTTTFSIGVLPVVSYSLTDKLSLEASCEFLRLGFDYSVTKNKDNSDYKDMSNSFGLGVNTGSYSFLSSSILNVGLILKF